MSGIFARIMMHVATNAVHYTSFFSLYYTKSVSLISTQDCTGASTYVRAVFECYSKVAPSHQHQEAAPARYNFSSLGS